MTDGQNLHPDIRQYLDGLANGLADLPQWERNQHISEIKSHLQSSVQNKKEKGIHEHMAVQDTLTEFLSVEKLAKQIVSETDGKDVVNNDSNHSFALERKTNVKALISLILGIISIVFWMISPITMTLAMIGIIFGVLGLKEVKRLKKTGRSVAIAGLICNAFGILFPSLMLILYFFSFSNPGMG